MIDKYFTVKEREQLYNEIWEEPISIVSKRYSVSDATLRKWCIKLNIPLPEKGHWQKIRLGKEVKKPELTKVFGKYVTAVSKSIIKYKYSSNELTDENLITLKDEELSLLTEETRNIIHKRCENIEVKNQLRNPHKHIVDHQEEIVSRKKKEKEIKEKSSLFNRYYNSDIVYYNFKSALPIKVSSESIKRVYRILDALFKKLEELDAAVIIQPYWGKDVADVRVGRHFFEFEVKEEAEKSNNKKKADKDDAEKTGQIVMQFLVKSSYGKDLNQCLQYKDSIDKPLEIQLKNIIYDLFVTSNRLDVLEEISSREIDRRTEEEKRKRLIEEKKKREFERMNELQKVITDWDQANKMREFARCLDENIDKMNVSDKSKTVLIIDWIRNKADWLDPLVAKEDELLGRKYDKNKGLIELEED